jgi:hypothetical protein
LGSQATSKAGEIASMGRGEDMTTLTGRIPLWEMLLEAIADSPIVGHGYLAYWDDEQVEYLSSTLRWEIPHGHNMYLVLTLDGGLIALALFMRVTRASICLGSSFAQWSTDLPNRCSKCRVFHSLFFLP